MDLLHGNEKELNELLEVKVPFEESLENVKREEESNECESFSQESSEHSSMINGSYDEDSIQNPVEIYLREDETITVNVSIPNEGVVSRVYRGMNSVRHIKEDLSKVKNLDINLLFLSLKGGTFLSDSIQLSSLQTDGRVLELNLYYTEEEDLFKENDKKYPPIISVRQVQVKTKTNETALVTVVIEDVSYVKEWLGGYRDKVTGQKYYHAATETSFLENGKVPKRLFALKCNTEAQTRFESIDRQCQTLVNKETQMWYHFFGDKDVYLKPKPYQESDKLDYLILDECATKIQKWYKRQKNRMKVRTAFSELIQVIKRENQQDKLDKQILNKDKVLNLIYYSSPVKKNDFLHLHTIISQWWSNEHNKIVGIINPEEKRIKLKELTHNEVEILFALETKKITAREDTTKRYELMLIENATKPIIRKFNNSKTIIETVETQKARQIKDAYINYSECTFSRKKRIKANILFCKIIETLEDESIQEVVTLLQRERDLINLKIHETLLSGLRKTIEELTLSYIKRSKITNKKILPKNSQEIMKTHFRCKGCAKLKSSSEFSLSTEMKSFDICKTCEWLKITTHNLPNLAPYALILDYLRESENFKSPENSHCHILQPEGAYFLINCIWHGKSVISETSYVPALRLVRWNQPEDWSPWNCILLTKEEGEIHERITCNEEVYEFDFIQSIKLRHINAKIRFRVLKETDEFIKQTKLWSSAAIKCKYPVCNNMDEILLSLDPFTNYLK